MPSIWLGHLDHQILPRDHQFAEMAVSEWGWSQTKPSSPGLFPGLESVDRVEEEELFMVRGAVIVDRALDIVETGAAVAVKLPRDVVTVLVFGVVTVVLMLDERLRIKKWHLKR